MVRGTPYHVGKDTDWEDLIARNLCKAGREATIHDHVWPEVNGCVFDLKHKVGGSSIPHGRGTSISKEKLWNSLWALHGGQQPDANVVLRGHVHYHICVSQAGWHAMTMPALQAAGTKYGGRQCSGTVDFGLMEFNINEKGAFRYEPHLLVPRNQTVKALKI